MKTNNWRLELRRDHILVTLYTMTTDDMAYEDLELPPGQSLIRVARQYHRRGQTDDQNQRDLAIGALMTYATEPIYDRHDARIEQVDRVPARPPNYFVGGASGDLVPIWEEASGSDPT